MSAATDTEQPVAGRALPGNGRRSCMRLTAICSSERVTPARAWTRSLS